MIAMKPEEWSEVGAILERMAQDHYDPELYFDYNPRDDELTEAWIVRLYPGGRRAELYVGETPLEAARKAHQATYGEIYVQELG
ncbi:MAG: hypothetical protein WC657_06585 [Candidatus Paceibacterota bacterium]|jgi:hypothetical protein